MTPPPGTTEAIAAGCVCPVLDNHYGQGVPHGDKRLWWFSDGCPVHEVKP